MRAVSCGDGATGRDRTFSHCMTRRVRCRRSCDASAIRHAAVEARCQAVACSVQTLVRGAVDLLSKQR
ncbi:hypothetical protein XMIN_3972 [Xanthomonas citri pv. mangiferaeindicae LMG 941]|nr:hypothetical protein XMIN_3972 [Xanthomonas citri pv. mangiferaeindicae LMG 941]